MRPIPVRDTWSTPRDRSEAILGPFRLLLLEEDQELAHLLGADPDARALVELSDDGIGTDLSTAPIFPVTLASKLRVTGAQQPKIRVDELPHLELERLQSEVTDVDRRAIPEPWVLLAGQVVGADLTGKRGSSPRLPLVSVLHSRESVV
jgi:hypothetical protein